jgi:xanthine dehydrogenase accessory factor
MDFQISLYDTRENLNTFVLNSFVHQKKILTDYQELETMVPSGSNQYVVIMTFGYRTDAIAIKALLHKQFKYMGVLGSSKKMQQLFTDFASQGIPSDQLAHIHTPIGIQIKSETPEEIAVSIAAQIIQVKNNL